MTRIFNHLDGSDPDEDRHFSRVARAMRSSPSWREIPSYATPSPVTGSIRAKTERGKRALCAVRRIMEEDGMTLREVAESMAEHVAARHFAMY